MAAWMEESLDDLKRRGLFRARRRVAFAPGPRIKISGRTLINFASNDYLGLASDVRLAGAAARAAMRYGSGASASPLITGWTHPLRRLEKALACWEETESSLVFATGFAANLGIIGSLAGEGDAIFSDEFNHASIIDGSRLSRARVHVYRHADANHLNDLLRKYGAAARRRLIASDSVFSMDGHIAPLAELLDLARRYDCLLLIDEAHATGVLGETGRGALESLPKDERLITVGTLSKALGSQGGFACGSRSLTNWLVNRARPYLFSTALAPPAAAAARQAIAIVIKEPERRRHLLSLAQFLRDQMRAKGFGDGGSSCQIVPLIVGGAAQAVRLSRKLEERGFLVPAIRPPSVPAGTARLRISLTAAHSQDDVSRLIEALQDCREFARGTKDAHG
jgi:8-amino-7-oxononanoate synthase